jgi:hypothetical protein
VPVLHEPLGHLGSPWEHHGQVFDTPGQPGLYVGDLITKIDEAPLRGDYDEALGIPGWNMVKHLQLPWWIRFLTSQVVMLWYVMGVGRVFWLKSWETHTHIYIIYIECDVDFQQWRIAAVTQIIRVVLIYIYLSTFPAHDQRNVAEKIGCSFPAGGEYLWAQFPRWSSPDHQERVLNILQWCFLRWRKWCLFHMVLPDSLPPTNSNRLH